MLTGVRSGGRFRPSWKSCGPTCRRLFRSSYPMRRCETFENRREKRSNNGLGSRLGQKVSDADDFPLVFGHYPPALDQYKSAQTAYMGPKNSASDLDAQNSGIRFKLLGLQATALSGLRPVC